MSYEGPITDNHIHIDPYNGEGPIETANKFQRAGGTSMIVIHKLSWNYEIEVKDSSDLKKAMDETIDFTEKINEETSVSAYPVVGVHPAEIIELLKDNSDEETRSMVREALDYTRDLYMENRIVGIGEIGRPHYDVDKDKLELSQDLMEYGMEIASDLDCPVQLHTESMGKEGIRDLGELGDRIGLNKIVKHFSPPLINVCKDFGILPSIIARSENLEKALKEGNDFLMETDFLDDSSRPGAVLGPKNVPKKTKKLLQSGLMDEEDAWKIHKDNIENLYGISMD